MFERRLKIILGLLGLVVAGLVLRAADVQLLDREYWKSQALDAMTHTDLVEPTRGRILDFRGRVLAEDRPCIDACVDYRAVTTEADDAWVKEQAIARLHEQLGDPYATASGAERTRMREAEMQSVRADIETMWEKLAKLSGRSMDDIDAVRESITRRVEMRRRYVWYHNFEKAVAKQAATHEETSAWRKWLVEGDNSTLDMDKFMVTVAEQLEPHVVLPAVDNDTQNELGKNIDHLPGLFLRPGTHRYYPYGDVACHVLGHLAKVDRTDLEADEKTDKDELREYLPNDLMGKTGIEELCEPALRGTRGRVEKVVGEDRILSTLDPVPGQDVRLSIDIDLQQQIQSAFADAQIRDPKTGKVVEPDAVLHGAAVVIDVATGGVRAMVSYPTYDENHLDEQYSALAADDLNHPLLNRATMAQVEPGSTVKPMVGLSAITSGVQGPDATIECTGYLVLDGHTYTSIGRCWVAKMYYKDLKGHVAHHPVPTDAPHPTGFLTFGDGLERSCNVFFETTADRLGIDRLSEWYSRFGLGRVTGIGIAEAKGRVPTDYPLPAWRRRAAGWFSGIGEGFIAATPIQMANVAATIARNGIWMRPTLLAPNDDGQFPPTRPGSVPDGPARVDLHLSPAALAEAHDGMYRVVNGNAGTGKGLIAGDDLLAGAMIDGKTGTAQTSPLGMPMLDSAGRPMLDEFGKPKMQLLVPSTPDQPNPLAPWYRGSGADHKDISHAWYIGFAPRDHPKIAFAVLVEYGGSGGIAAASVARELLEGCIAHGYLDAPGASKVVITQPAPVADTGDVFAKPN